MHTITKNPMKMKYNLYLIDLFCGAGGVSEGWERAHVNGEKAAKIIACVNHDPMAILSHLANHPETLHFTEDIRQLDISKICQMVHSIRATDPLAVICLWASLECTNFSKAKGGLPRDADSRTLADELFRYIEGIGPDYIHIENVEEFMSWGPLDENGKPVSKDKGNEYVRWVNQVKAHGYNFEHRILNAADYGAYTSRKRYFGIFAKGNLPICFPKPTHSKKPEGELKKWNAVRHVLNLDDIGDSIFTRKKPLSEKTMERIYAGLIKFVAGGKSEFMLKYNSINKQTGKHVPPSVDEPCPTVAAQARLGLVQAEFITKYYSGRPENKVADINEPAAAIRTKDGQALIQPCFIASYYGSGHNCTPIDNPSPTLRTKDGGSLVSAQFIYMPYSNGGSTKGLNEPMGAILTKPKGDIVSCEPFIANTNFRNTGNSINEPSPVITANRKHHYLINPQWGTECSRSIDRPAFTLVARMDKTPPYLVEVEGGGYIIEVYSTDSECTRKIKEFMAIYGIIDIKMRMLRIVELLRIMGFGDDYILKGTQTDMKRFIGNAVEVNQARVIAEATVNGLLKSHAESVAA